jgi:predicted nucleic acid-binding protein
VVIVDTSVWIDFLNGTTTPETQWLDLRLDTDRFGLTTIILAEVLQGLRDDREAALVEAELLRFEVVQIPDARLAAAAARNYRALRARGRTIRKTIDCLIATYCIEHGHALLHTDRDYDAFEEHLGLTVVRP